MGKKQKTHAWFVLLARAVLASSRLTACPADKALPERKPGQISNSHSLAPFRFTRERLELLSDFNWGPCPFFANILILPV